MTFPILPGATLSLSKDLNPFLVGGAAIVCIKFPSLPTWRPACGSGSRATAPQYSIYHMTLAPWGRFKKVCFQSHALGVIFNDVLGGCPAVHVHLHQFVVQAVGLVETLAEFHQLKVLGPDVLQVRQLGLLIDAISPTDVALALDDPEIEKLDLSGKLGDLPVKSFCYFLIIISILSPLPSSRRGHRDVDTKRFIKVF